VPLADEEGGNVPREHPADGWHLRLLESLGQRIDAGRGDGRGLAAVRQDEIVGITPLSREGTAPAIKAIRRSCTALARRGVRLAGASTCTSTRPTTAWSGSPNVPAATCAACPTSWS
jgi:hypothetical protein